MTKDLHRDGGNLTTLKISPKESPWVDRVYHPSSEAMPCLMPYTRPAPIP
jgi:hypothetical protein